MTLPELIDSYRINLDPAYFKIFTDSLATLTDHQKAYIDLNTITYQCQKKADLWANDLSVALANAIYGSATITAGNTQRLDAIELEMEFNGSNHKEFVYSGFVVTDVNVYTNGVLTFTKKFTYINDVVVSEKITRINPHQELVKTFNYNNGMVTSIDTVIT